MTKGISHDEHQHIAAGCLVLRHGLSPYAGFPYFHTPYLPYLYGLLFHLPGGLLLLARAASALAAAATAGLACAFVYRRFARRDTIVAFLTAAAMLSVLIFSPVWTLTTGRAWNQEISLLFAVLALLKASDAAEASSRPRAWAVAGLMLGLAVGFRITHAPLAAPLLAWALWSARWRNGWARLDHATWFTGGLATALIPLVWLYLRSPERAWFGMLGFAGANLEYLEAAGKIQHSSAELKFQVFSSEFLVLEWALLAALGLLLVCIAASAAARSAVLRKGAGWFVFAMPFVLVGAFAPTPAFPHYFYHVFVFAALTTATLLSNVLGSGTRRWFPAALAISLAIVAVIAGRNGYENSRKKSQMSRWTPIRTREEGAQIRQQVAVGTRIFTLAPLWALEGGFDIDPRLSTGPFAWRVARTLPEAEVNRLLLPSMRMITDESAPVVFHLGHEKRLETDLLSFVEAHHYTAIREVARGDLWIAPATTPSR